MNKLLAAMFVALLMAGCGSEEDIAIPKMIKCDGCQKAVYSSADDCPNCGHPVEDSVGVYVEEREEIIKQAYDFIGLTEEEARNEANQGGGKEREEIIKRGNEILRLTVDLDDKETRNRIIAEAIDGNKLQNRGEKGEELLYAPNEQTPYTGWLKVMYENGQIKVLGQLKDGKPSRLTQWYENGQKGSEEINKAGKNVTARWYENGNKAERFTVINGQKHGPWTSWYENGLKKAELNWEGGELEGLYTLWYDNGLKAKEGSFKDGKGGLDFKTWCRENELKKEGTKFKLSDAQRDAIKEGQFLPPPSDIQDIASAIDVKKLQKRGVKGEELSYPPNEQKPYTGWVKWMYENGQMAGLAQFKDGKPDGLWYDWYENGQKRGEVTYKEGKLMTFVSWKPDGDKCPDTNIFDGNGVTVAYNDKGTEVARLTYKDGEIVSN
jgi:antitoxin component YwqK of YwqJK toxin-antitoxin module